AKKLWPITNLGVRVIVARDELMPAEFVHAKLFVPRSKPAEPQTTMNVATEGAAQPTANLAEATIALPDRVLSDAVPDPMGSSDAVKPSPTIDPPKPGIPPDTAP